MNRKPPTTYHNVDCNSYNCTKNSRAPRNPPKVYRLRPMSPSYTKSSSEDELNYFGQKDRVVTPSKYRLKKHLARPVDSNQTNSNFNKSKSAEPVDHKITKPCKKKRTFVWGDFILTEKSNEDSGVYTDEAKCGPITYLSKEVIDSSGSHRQDRSSTYNNGLNTDFRPSSILLQSLSEDNLNHVVCETFGRECEPLPRLCPNSNNNLPDIPYYFGEGRQVSIISNNDCKKPSISPPPYLPSPIQQRPVTTQTSLNNRRSTFSGSFDRTNDNATNIIFQEVVDAGTSIDSELLDPMPMNRNYNDESPRLIARYSNARDSVFTQQSSRSESETYRVAEETRRKEHEEHESLYAASPQSPSDLSHSNSTIKYSFINEKKTSVYDSDVASSDQISRKLSRIPSNDEESLQSSVKTGTSIVQPTITNLPADNQSNQYYNLNTNSYYAPSLSQQSGNTYDSRRSWWDKLTGRNKDKISNKKIEKKK